TFKITGLKESERCVRVKLSRIREHGVSMGLGGESTKVEVFEGFLLFAGSDIEVKNVLKQKVSLIPFKFNAHKSWANSFDVGFRYDLKYPEARTSYKKAVFGDFKSSSSFDGRSDPQTKETPVARIFTRNADSIQRIQ